MGARNKEDGPEQIQQCLNCKWPECVNCLDIHHRTSTGVRDERARKKERIEGLVRQGLTDRKIAAALGLSEYTIRLHRTKVLGIPVNGGGATPC